jgi:hypothetical protein
MALVGCDDDEEEEEEEEKEEEVEEGILCVVRDNW